MRRNRERDRYYLLPGMGGRSHRRRHRQFLIAAIIVGLLVATALGLILYFANRGV